MRLDARLNLDQPDGHVWLNDESRAAVVRVIRQYQPKVLLTTHWDDPHPDHANTCAYCSRSGKTGDNGALRR
jgi:LmbE family N-acetylglucosaminyl deacetylase